MGVKINRQGHKTDRQRYLISLKSEGGKEKSADSSEGLNRDTYEHAKAKSNVRVCCGQ